ncbi:MAG: hypothetical protein FWE06_02540 [Oscillospiraceae bacterium]|nr:hypothetical protein [Oscillospiraceae bacterium]
MYSRYMKSENAENSVGRGDLDTPPVESQKNKTPTLELKSPEATPVKRSGNNDMLLLILLLLMLQDSSGATAALGENMELLIMLVLLLG